MKGCAATRRRMLLAADGRLPIEESFLVDEHVEACSACAAYRATLEGIEEGLAAQVTPEVGPDEVERALASLNRALDSADLPRAPERPRIGTLWQAAAAAAAVFALIWIVQESGSGSTSIHQPGDVNQSGGALEVASAALPPVTPPETPDEVQAAVRAILLALAEEGAAADTEFDARTRDLRRSGWPLRRYVERALEDARPEVVTKAIEYLGAHGDERSAGLLVAMADQGRYSEDLLAAWERLGNRARPGLLRAWRSPADSPLLTAALVRLGGPEAAQLFVDHLRERDPDEARHLAGLTALTRLDASSAVDALLRLLEEPETTLPRNSVYSQPERWSELLQLQLVEVVPGGREELARVFRDRTDAYEVDVLLQVAAHRPTPEAWAFVEERAASRRTRAVALETVVAAGGPGAHGLLVSLDESGRAPRHAVVATLARLLETEAQGVAQRAGSVLFTQDLVQAGLSSRQERWEELLLDVDAAAAGPALAVLALEGEFEDDRAAWLALAVGDLESRVGAQRLVEGYTAVDSEARRLRAAILITLHRVLGSETVQELLGGRDDRPALRLDQALAAVSDRGPSVGLHRVVRALEGLESPGRSSRRFSRP